MTAHPDNSARAAELPKSFTILLFAIVIFLQLMERSVSGLRVPLGATGAAPADVVLSGCDGWTRGQRQTAQQHVLMRRVSLTGVEVRAAISVLPGQDRAGQATRGRYQRVVPGLWRAAIWVVARDPDAGAHSAARDCTRQRSR
jgi:hypothetical protein